MEPPRPIRAPSPVQREGLAAFLFDLHAPLLDAAAWFCARSWLRANRPAVVVLGGDVGEWESCSMHGGSPASPSFLADVRETAGVLRDIREDAPDAELYFLEGNHETRLSRMIAERAPAVAGAVTVQDALELDRWRCRWIPEDEQPLRLPGGLVLLHGHQLGGRPSVYYSRRLADVYGSPGSVVVAGHGHKSQRHRRPMAEGHAEGISVPCLRQLKAGWLHGEVSGWTHGFAVATMIEGRRSTVEVLDIEDGIACWGGRRYAA